MLKKFSPKQLVLQGFLELSESPIHFSIASRQFMWIAEEIVAEYERNMIGISIGIFFFTGCPDSSHHLMESSLK